MSRNEIIVRHWARCNCYQLHPYVHLPDSCLVNRTLLGCFGLIEYFLLVFPISVQRQEEVTYDRWHREIVRLDYQHDASVHELNHTPCRLTGRWIQGDRLGYLDRQLQHDWSLRHHYPSGESPCSPVSGPLLASYVSCLAPKSQTKQQCHQRDRPPD